MVGGSAMTRKAGPGNHATRLEASADAIAQLIGRAERHPLGVTFLRDGSLDAVAATFGVHAFTIEAARARLAETRASRVSPALRGPPR